MTTTAIPSPKGETQLENCPFCGSHDCRVIGGPGTRGGPKYWAGCDHCNGRAWGDTQAEAIAAWNRRSSSSREEVRREALEEHIGALLRIYEGVDIPDANDRARAHEIATAFGERCLAAALSQGE